MYRLAGLFYSGFASMSKIPLTKTPFPESGANAWDAAYESVQERRMYDDPMTARMAGSFLNHPDIITVEDWGCGLGGFRDYIADHQTYIGVDGSNTPFRTVEADLKTYTSTADAIHIRHVLEHNMCWKMILKNALASFQKRMVITIFTPFQKRTRLIGKYDSFRGGNMAIPDIGFGKSAFVKLLKPAPLVMLEAVESRTQYKQEQILFFER